MLSDVLKKHFGNGQWNRPMVAFWIVFHLVLIGIPLFLYPIKINTDLYSVLPASHELHKVSEAERALSSKTTSQFYVLVGHENFETAKKASEILYAAIKEDHSLDTVRLYVDPSSMQEIQNFLFAHRYQMQGPEMVRQLEKGEVDRISSDALSSVYGAFQFSSLDNLAKDPFLLGENSLNRYLSSSLFSSLAFGIKENVLVASDSGVQYVMLSGSLAPHVSAIAKEGHIIGRINELCAKMEKETPGLRLAFSGVPFHSYESSSNAQNEVMIISIISMLAIIVLFILVFRSPVPLVMVIGYIFVAGLTALCCTLWAFKEIHIFTFVFGTSLIGICIDYSVHFFMDWKSSQENKTGFDVRAHIFKGVILGFLTTEAGYLAVMLAPFPLLKQMALFSFAGLLSSLLTIMIIFPNLKLPTVEKRIVPLKAADILLKVYARIFALKRPAWICIWMVAIAVIISGLMRLNMENDIRGLYSMSDHLKKSEQLAARVMNLGTSGWFFIISGKSPEEVLQREERLCSRLDAEKEKGQLSSYMATTLFVPSLATQNHTYSLIREKLLPSSQNQLTQLGFGTAENEQFLADFSAASKAMVTMDSKLPSNLGPMLNTLWLGKIDGVYYSAVLPLHAKDQMVFKEMASEMDSVYFVDKMTDIGNELTRLSHIALGLVILAYALVLVVLSFVYGFRAAFRIIRTPLLACIIAASLLGHLGIPYNFFAIVGAILTLSIGIDYSLFFKENAKTMRTTMLAVLLSVVTTLLSFGALGLSSFAPVSTFGLSVLFGISFCFFLAPFNGTRPQK